jgi:Tol biopolymer transport system component
VFAATNDSGLNPKRRLYTMAADGSGIRPLTRAGWDATWPSWSPDGRWIAFTHAWVIYLVHPDGSGLHRIGDGLDPAWSPRGRRIAYTCGISICTMNPDGSDVRVAAQAPPETGDPPDCHNAAYAEPTWSPDGEFVAFAVSGAGGECGYSVWIGVNRGYGAPTKLLLDGWYEQPDWARRGGAIAITQTTPDDLPVNVVVFTAKRRPTVFRSGWHPRFSPDAKRIAFVRGSIDEETQIYVMNADGSGVTELTR